MIRLLILLSIVATPALNAADWYVDDNAAGDPAPGDPSISNPLEDGSVGAPFDAIQEAISAASSTDVVHVLAGTYTGTGNRDLDLQGKQISVVGDAGAAMTIIDCQGSEVEPHRGFLVNGGETTATVVSGVTIRNGHSDGGSGLRVVNGSAVRVENCVIETCQTVAGRGGGIEVFAAAHLELVGSTVTGCSAFRGGGIAVLGSATVIDSTVSLCTGTEYSGGIHVENSDATIDLQGGAVTGNSCVGTGGGGGMALHFGQPSATITGTVFSLNEVLSAWGGGLGIQAGDITVTNAQFISNTASRGGGVSVTSNGNVALSGCEVVTNTAVNEFGGGVYVAFAGSEPVFSACTIRDNECDDGGGGVAFHFGGAGTLIDCTIFNNIAPAIGAGVYVVASSDATILGGTIGPHTTPGKGAGLAVNSGCSAVLSGVTFTQNTADGADGGGGVFLAANSHAVISECEFLANHATSGNGGGLATGNGTEAVLLQLVGGEFNGNTAANFGGGASLINVRGRVDSVTFKTNTAAIRGGGLEVANSLDLDFEDLFVNGNSSQTGGGADVNAGCDVHFKSCDFIMNFATGLVFNAGGAGVHVFGGDSDLDTTRAVFTDCNIRDNESDAPGGGISFFKDAVGELINCEITGNVAADNGVGTCYGGGLLVYGNAGGTPATVEVCGGLIDNNSACEGGGIALYDGTESTIRNAQISNNHATTGAGGGIQVLGTDTAPTITGCVIQGNDAGHRAGGLHFQGTAGFGGPSGLVEDCLITGNSVAAGGFWGGGMVIQHESSPTVRRCSFMGNDAPWAGALQVSSDSQPVVVDCSFTGNEATVFDGGAISVGDVVDLETTPLFVNCRMEANSAAGRGGGIAVGGGAEPWFVNCHVAGNSANEGGGIATQFDNSGDPHFTNCTVVNNTATVLGGGLYAFDGYLRMENSVVWENTPSAPSLAGTSSMDITYTCIEGGFTGAGNVSLDPLFVDPVADDYTPSSDSPCVDAANGDAFLVDLMDYDSDVDASEFFPVDLDQLPRLFNDMTIPDTGVGTVTHLDMGAFEYRKFEPGPFKRGDANSDDTIDIADVIVTLDYLFLGGSAGCPDALDANDDGAISLSDPIRLLDWLYGECGLPPAYPYQECAPDLTEDALGCFFGGCP